LEPTPDAGVVAPDEVSPAHVGWHAVFVVVVLGALVWLILPQLGEVPEAWSAIRHADPIWLAVGAMATAAVFFAGGLQLIGATRPHVSVGRAAEAQLAASFAAKLTPASVGAVGVRVRFLHRSGLETAEAVGSTALYSLANGIVHFAWLIGAFVFAGGSAFGSDVTLPNGWELLAGVFVVLSASGVVAFLPRARRWIALRVRPALLDLAGVLRRPAKAGQLLGGAAAQTGCFMVAFGASLAAVGAGTSVGTMMIVYLAGSTVAAAAPTPGGLGAVEAALVAGLTATGTPTDLAVAGVLVFRILTYWLTFIPSWLAVRALRQRELL
jgi:glycosyltransferase 2 family protein